MFEFRVFMALGKKLVLNSGSFLSTYMCSLTEIDVLNKSIRLNFRYTFNLQHEEYGGRDLST